MINQEQIASVLNSYSDYYSLGEWEVLRVVEQSIAETMAMRYQRYSEVYIDSETYKLDIFLYSGQWGEMHQEAVPLSKVRGWNQIHRHLEHNVKKYISRNDYCYLRPHIGELCKGAITTIKDNGDVYVEIILKDQITAKWPLINQPKQEREEGYLYGENKIFRIKNVITGHERGEPQTYVVVERNSCSFVTALLHHWSSFDSTIKCKCVKRNTGKFAEIWTNTFLDKRVLKKIHNETGEFLTVCIGNNKKEILESRKKQSTQHKQNSKNEIKNKPKDPPIIDLYEEFLNA